jgi:hypothetical protein
MRAALHAELDSLAGNVSDICLSHRVDLSVPAQLATSRRLTRERLAELKVTAKAFSFQIFGSGRHRPKLLRHQRL